MKATCANGECGTPAVARGLCRKHYEQLRRTQGPFPPLNKPTGLALMRVRSHFEPGALETDCLVWDGHRNRLGYGEIGAGNRIWLTHRLAWVSQFGEIPVATPCVLHACDNPPCWRSDGPLQFYEVNGVQRPRRGHLWLGTKGENMEDKVAKGRQQSPRAEVNRRKTHCPQGHAYDEDNTWHYASGRACKSCVRARGRLRARE